MTCNGVLGSLGNRKSTLGPEGSFLKASPMNTTPIYLKNHRHLYE